MIHLRSELIPQGDPHRRPSCSVKHFKSLWWIEGFLRRWSLRYIRGHVAAETPRCLKRHPPLVAKRRITTAQCATGSSSRQLLLSTSNCGVYAGLRWEVIIGSTRQLSHWIMARKSMYSECCIQVHLFYFFLYFNKSICFKNKVHL